MNRFTSILMAIMVAASAIAANYSGTLPVMFINTENSAPITSKEDYINATYYLETFGLEGYTPIGTADAQLPMEIRGRGNYTWTGFDKKPYRVKFAAKAAILGMKKSKHFALLAHADDDLAFLRNTVGFELSRRLGLPYTPEQRPVEVVLNGDYIGLYMLTETIRVDKDRVNIVEQADNATDATEITGGWLVEIDNYDDPCQIKVQEGNGEVLRVTYKTPEILSAQQTTYLTDQINAIDDAVYATDPASTAMSALVDIDDLVRFYIVNEMMDNAESFHGSCYMHKELGTDTKWHFGPVWDFGNSFHRGGMKFIHQDPPFGQTWIAEMVKFDDFKKALKLHWNTLYSAGRANVNDFIDDFIAKISQAAAADRRRWPNYGTGDIAYSTKMMKSHLANRRGWLNSQWFDAAVEPITDSSHAINIINHDGNVTITTTGTDIATIAAHNLTGALIGNYSTGSTVSDYSTASSTRSATIALPSGVAIITIALSDGTRHTAKVMIR